MKLSALLTLAVALTVVNARAIDGRQEDSMYDAYHESNDYNLYPAPQTNGGKAWKDAFKKAKDIVSQMTLEEKSGLILSHDGRCVGTTHGVERLGIPELCLM